MTNAVEVHNLTKVYKIFPRSIIRALDAVGIKQKYEEFRALNNVNLDFEEGEVHAILGKNGSGKSTLLKIITGVVTPTSGEIVVNGRISAMLELTSGFDPDLTGIENVYMKALTMGLEQSEIEDRIQDIIDFADIGDHINQPFRTYSSGMRARLGFAVAVNVNPDILIVDEVLAVGDDIFKMKCIDRMASFRRAGKTILFVSHSLNTVKAFCTRGVWLNKGNVEVQGSLGEAIVKYEAYLKEERARVREETLMKAAKNPQAVSRRALTKSDLIKTGGFTFVDADGEPTDTVAYGEDITWTVEYEVKTDQMGELTACFSIHDAEQLEVFMLDKRRFSIDSSPGVHKGKFTIKAPKLMAGKFLITGEIWELDSSCVFRYASKRPLFVMQEDYLGTGAVFFDHECVIDGNEVDPIVYELPEEENGVVPMEIDETGEVEVG